MQCKHHKCTNEIDYSKRSSHAKFCSDKCVNSYHYYKKKAKRLARVGNGSSNVIPLYTGTGKGEGIKSPRKQKNIFGDDVEMDESTGKPKIEPQPATTKMPNFEKFKFSKNFDFLRVEKKKTGSVFMSLDAPAGAGKTTLLFQIVGDAAKNGNKVLFISLEESPTSSLFIEKSKKFWEQESIKNIETVDHVSDKNELLKLCNDYDVIAIDSFGKLPKGIEVESFRHDVDGAFIIAIFQQTNDGKTRGGSVVGFDADLVGKMKVEGEGDEKESWVYFDKMRYNGEKQGEPLYNAFGKAEVKEIQAEEDEPTEPTPHTHTEGDNGGIVYEPIDIEGIKKRVEKEVEEEMAMVEQMEQMQQPATTIWQDITNFYQSNKRKINVSVMSVGAWYLFKLWKSKNKK